MISKVYYVFIGIFIAITSITASNLDSEVDSLISSKKYNSAFQLLNISDPNNLSPEIVLRKTDIALNYFVNSLMHQMFAFKDLEIDEDILDLRGSEGDFDMYHFDIGKILDTLITLYPDNYKIHRELGFYYHEVHLKYGNSWLLPDSQVVNLFQKYYTIAWQHDEYDYYSLFGIGYAHLINQDYHGSESFFLKSIELNDKYPSSQYNLAYCYLQSDDRNKALHYAKNALNLYEYAPYKADAARIIAVIYSELESDTLSLKYYLMSNEYDPNNYYTLKRLLNLELGLNDSINLNLSLEQFFELDPNNPTIYNDLIDIYYSNNGEKDLINFFESKILLYTDEAKISGNLYFYLGQIYLKIENREKSVKSFEKARENFKEVFEPDHEVFKIIQDYIN